MDDHLNDQDDPDPHHLDAIAHERAFALLLGTLIRQDLTGDVDLAWRAAEHFLGPLDDE